MSSEIECTALHSKELTYTEEVINLIEASEPAGLLPGENLRGRQKRLTRRRLVEAAFELFLKHGYQGTTVESVCEAAGSSRATFYLHFGSMVDVALELMKEAEPEFINFYRELDELQDPTLDDLREWAGQVLVTWRRHKVRFEALEQVLATVSSLSSSWFASTQRSIDAMPRYLARWASVGRADHGRNRLMALIMQYERLAYFTVVRDAPISESELVDILSEQAWLLLRQDPKQLLPVIEA